MATTNWDDLLIDTQAVLVPLDEGRFRQWLASQRIFMSSVMDAELNPYRQAVRDFLQPFGVGVPVMWETISPADVHPERAYIAGVDSASLFVLIFGSRYGVAAASGFSPTHQEANRAKERHLPRWLFTLPAGGTPADGRLQDWKGSLYNEISANQVAGPANLVAQLKAKLEETAARSEREWIKLGRCVFVGTVSVKTDPSAGRSFRVIAKARNLQVRHELQAMGDATFRREVRLTSSKGSFQVVIESVDEDGEFVGESDFRIVCKTARNPSGDTAGQQYNMMVNGVGPDQSARKWAEHVILGKPLPDDRSMGGLGLFGIRPDAPTLPSVLTSTRVQGWQADGLARLYAIEEVARVRGGRWAELSVGPATAVGVRVEGNFSLPSYGASSTPVPVDGVVPLG